MLFLIKTLLFFNHICVFWFCMLIKKQNIFLYKQNCLNRLKRRGDHRKIMQEK